jgi:hypothetical protein
MGDAMIAALSPELNGPGGCNEGFVRDDALLVVVFISDVNDQGQSYASSSTRRSSRPRATRTPSSCSRSCRNAQGSSSPLKTALRGTVVWQLRVLLSRFPYTVFGDTCAPSFAPFFDEAVGKISEACESFIPQ